MRNAKEALSIRGSEPGMSGNMTKEAPGHQGLRTRNPACQVCGFYACGPGSCIFRFAKNRGFFVFSWSFN